MERNAIILIVSIALVGLFLSEVNDVTGQGFSSFFRFIGAKTVIPQGNCSDTDGADLSVKGTVSGTLRGSSFTNADVCISKRVVNEYYCDTNGLSQNKNYACPADYDCQDGVCV